MQIEFAPKEVETLIAVVDFALKADGLKGVNIYVPLAQKLSQALQNEPKVEVVGIEDAPKEEKKK